MAAKHSQQYCGCFAALLFLNLHVQQVATHLNGKHTVLSGILQYHYCKMAVSVHMDCHLICLFIQSELQYLIF